MHEIGELTLRQYKETMRRREARTRQALEERKARAWAVARHAAVLLYDRFNASHVITFGSLVHGMWFSPTSDIDLAAWNIADEDYFTAVAQLQDLATEFRIDLVAMERCKASLREVIEREGVQL